MAPRINRLLIANRGEVAARIMRTAQKMGIETVAVHSDADADAPYLALADRTVRLPGVASLETYLDAERVIEAALAAGADAVHPGYGFLAENPRFARDVMRHDLTWVGPSPASIEAKTPTGQRGVVIEDLRMRGECHARTRGQ